MGLGRVADREAAKVDRLMTKEMDFTKLNREQLLHIVEDTLREGIELGLRGNWQMQEDMKAKSSSGRAVCHDCDAIRRLLEE